MSAWAWARGPTRHTQGHVCVNVQARALSWVGLGGQHLSLASTALAGPRHPGESHQGELQAGG